MYKIFIRKYSKMNVTPSMINNLNPGEIFVFGSNLEGLHAGGAAKFALQFGAEWGNGVGIQGQTYAIPTLSHPGGIEEHMLKVSTIGKFVKQFIAYAKSHPENYFLVTPIGCGIAGFTPEQIAPLFKNALGLNNVSLPQEFLSVLLPSKRFSLNNLKGLISNSIKNVLKEEGYI